jgi:hypothetical protein
MSIFDFLQKTNSLRFVCSIKMPDCPKHCVCQWRIKSLDKLPQELLLKILSYVAHDDFRTVRLLNRRFNELSKDKSLWTKVRHSIIP